MRGLEADPGDYFRKQLFDTSTWRRSRDSAGNPIMITDVDFDVTLGCMALGRMTLRLDYGAFREGGRGRATMLLHLGSLRTYLLQRNYTGWYMIIERTGSNSYTLRITKSRPA
jgi:hypothetical protein